MRRRPRRTCTRSSNAISISAWIWTSRTRGSVATSIGRRISLRHNSRKGLGRGEEGEGAHEGLVHVRGIVVPKPFAHVELRAHAVCREEFDERASAREARVLVADDHI